jgi:hypothetical protein
MFNILISLSLIIVQNTDSWARLAGSKSLLSYFLGKLHDLDEQVIFSYLTQWA